MYKQKYHNILRAVAARGGGAGGENSQTYEILFPLEINVVSAVLCIVFRILIMYMIFINLRSFYKY